MTRVFLSEPASLWVSRATSFRTGSESVGRSALLEEILRLRPLVRPPLWMTPSGSMWLPRPATSREAEFGWGAVSSSSDLPSFSMRVGQTLRPGQRGTRRYVERYGDRLVCVRYRYDEARQRRLTTVELVADVGPWMPRAGTVVGVRVAWGEAEVAQRVKSAGGIWDARQKVWRLRAGDVRRLGLADRMVRVPTDSDGGESLHLPACHSMG